MNFTIKSGLSSITGNTEDWGVSTVGEAVNCKRAIAGLGLGSTSGLGIFVSNTRVDSNHPILDGAVITVQQLLGEKG
jgi:hypothetical protein